MKGHIFTRSCPPGTSETVPPAHWPKHLRFLQSCVYHSSITTSIRQELRQASIDSKQSTEATSCRNRKVVIRAITDPSHPANGQFGLHAGEKIPPKTCIIQYIGEIHCDDRPHSDYDLSLVRLPNGVSIGIDASAMGNQARFINDYRGISSRPNAVFQEGRTLDEEVCMEIWSGGKEIKKGDEILVSYGKSWWKCRSPSTDDEDTHS